MLGVLLGTGAGFFVGHLRPGVVAALLATCILLYDAWLKRTPLGPLAMGACRMLNVLLGMNALDVPLHAEHWLVAGGIGVYVAGVTWFARRESQREQPAATGAGHAGDGAGHRHAGLVSQLVGPDSSSGDRSSATRTRWYLLTGVLGMLIVWRCLWAVIEPVPARVRMAVAQCVLSIVMLDAVACYAIRGVFWASMILLLLLPAMFLGRWIETT